MNTAEGLQMRQKILEFMRENDIAVCAETDRTTGTVHIEKLGPVSAAGAVFRYGYLVRQYPKPVPLSGLGAGGYRMPALLAGRRQGCRPVFRLPTDRGSVYEVGQSAGSKGAPNV